MFPESTIGNPRSEIENLRPGVVGYTQVNRLHDRFISGITPRSDEFVAGTMEPGAAAEQAGVTGVTLEDNRPVSCEFLCQIIPGRVDSDDVSSVLHRFVRQGVSVFTDATGRRFGYSYAKAGRIL